MCGNWFTLKSIFSLLLDMGAGKEVQTRRIHEQEEQCTDLPASSAVQYTLHVCVISEQTLS